MSCCATCGNSHTLEKAAFEGIFIAWGGHALIASRLGHEVGRTAPEEILTRLVRDPAEIHFSLGWKTLLDSSFDSTASDERLVVLQPARDQEDAHEARVTSPERGVPMVPVS